ncbi:MAG: hypothetical protein QHJ73_06695, partial [Armatimonadota bacterium]|nr:hypothetical protein [Armatimonadota bacterium]
TITGTAVVENAVLGGGAGTVALANARVRLVRRTSPTEVVPVGVETTTDANGNFTIGPVDLLTAQLNDVWEVQVLGSAGGGPVFVSKAVVPASVAGSTVPVSVASTIVAAFLAQGARNGEAGTFAQADVDRAIAAMSANLTGVGISAFRPDATTFSGLNLVALYNAIRTAGTGAVNAAVAAIRFRTADGLATEGALTIQQGASGVVVAEPVDAAGNVLALGVNFGAVSGVTGVTAEAISANQVKLTASSSAAGTGTLSASVASKSATLAIKVVTIHQQAHIQGGSGTLPLP